LLPPAGDGVDVVGAIAVEGVVAAGVPGLAPPAGEDDGIPGGAAADGDAGAITFPAGTCDGAATIAAEGAVGVAAVPVGPGRG